MNEISFNLRIIFLQNGFGITPFPETVKKHFESQGFTVKKTNPKNGLRGIPDLLVSNGKQTFYVEVKAHNDSFRIDQIKWFSKHSEDSFLVIEELPIIDKIQEQREQIIEDLIEDLQNKPKKDLERKQQLKIERNKPIIEEIKDLEESLKTFECVLEKYTILQTDEGLQTIINEKKDRIAQLRQKLLLV